MKKILITSLILSSATFSSFTFADNHTVSLGYVQSKVNHSNNINGVNAQYRYEWDSSVSIVGSFSFMKSDLNYSYRTEGYNEIVGYDSKTGLQYYSLLGGGGIPY